MGDIRVAMCTPKGYGCLDLFGHKKYVVTKINKRLLVAYTHAQVRQVV